jgi:hypothetical protein
VLLALAALVCLASVAAAQAPADDGPNQIAGAVNSGLRVVQQNLAEAFTQGDPDRLAATLSQVMKTYVSSRPIDVGDGYYGADQMRLFFRRMFRSRRSVRFLITEPAEAPRPDGRAVAIAEWSYRESGGTPVEARLAFTLGLESGVWRVREIRDLK